MSIEEIVEKSGMTKDLAESIYWHSIWIRKANKNEKVDFFRLLNDEEYRRFGNVLHLQTKKQNQW